MIAYRQLLDEPSVQRVLLGVAREPCLVELLGREACGKPDCCPCEARRLTAGAVWLRRG